MNATGALQRCPVVLLGTDCCNVLASSASCLHCRVLGAIHPCRYVEDWNATGVTFKFDADTAEVRSWQHRQHEACCPWPFGLARSCATTAASFEGCRCVRPLTLHCLTLPPAAAGSAWTQRHQHSLGRSDAGGPSRSWRWGFRHLPQRARLLTQLLVQPAWHSQLSPSPVDCPGCAGNPCGCRLGAAARGQRSSQRRRAGCGLRLQPLAAGALRMGRTVGLGRSGSSKRGWVSAGHGRKRPRICACHVAFTAGFCCNVQELPLTDAWLCARRQQ